jgi:hypothetical protein
MYCPPPSCYMPHPSYPPWLDHSDYTSRTVEVMKLLISHYAVFSNFLSLHLSYAQIFSSAPCFQTTSLLPELLLYPTQLLSVPKLLTYLRFQHDTAFYPLPILISWDWTSPYESWGKACFVLEMFMSNDEYETYFNELRDSCFLYNVKKW